MFTFANPVCPNASGRLAPRGTRRVAGFTLVEILVVLGIIVILAALLVPAAMRALYSARNARIGIEISQLNSALEAYKVKTGDYPPSMGENYSAATRSFTACEQHFRKAYPNMDPAVKTYFYDNMAPLLNQQEALVLFLSAISTDQRNPFNTITGFPGYNAAASKVSYYDFTQSRLRDDDGDGLNSYEAASCKGTFYVYLDSRTYSIHATPATAACGVAQPYFDQAGVVLNRNSFQILCSGQDGAFGALYDLSTSVKRFPIGLNYATNGDDDDNITNFSEGKTLKSMIPQ